MRILVVMASPEYLRYYDSTIRLLATRGHEVLVGVMQQKDAKPVRLEEHGLADGVRVLGLVPRRVDGWAPLARLVRGTMDYVRYLHPRYSSAHALRARLVRKGLPRPLRRIDARLGVCSDATVRHLLRFLAAVERGIPTCSAADVFLKEHSPDVVLVSPLVDVASEEVDIVRSARRLGIRVAVGIASWDNLTNKGLLRVEPDVVLVWNDAQKTEAVELHGIAPERVVVTGAQLFDRWFHKQPARSLEAFASRVGLPAAERFILFTGSSMFISAPEAEVAFVKRWLSALRGSRHAILRDTPVLIRPHPYNGWIWADVDVSEFPRVAVWPRGAYNAVDAGNRDDFFDSLYYSRAVVGINTSAMIEAAILGRPVHSIVGEDFDKTQEGTLHFHHLLPENGGFLQVGRGLGPHSDLLAASLGDEAAAREQTRAFVGWFLRPHGIDRECTPIVADALERLSAAPVRAPERVGLARALSWALRPLATLLARAGSRSKKDRRGRVLVRRATRMGQQARKRTASAFRSTHKKVRRFRKDVAVRVRRSV